MSTSRTPISSAKMDRRISDLIAESLAAGLGLLSAGAMAYGTAGGAVAEMMPIALLLALLGLGVLGAGDAARFVARCTRTSG